MLATPVKWKPAPKWPENMLFRFASGHGLVKECRSNKTVYYNE